MLSSTSSSTAFARTAVTSRYRCHWWPLLLLLLILQSWVAWWCVLSGVLYPCLGPVVSPAPGLGWLGKGLQPHLVQPYHGLNQEKKKSRGRSARFSWRLWLRFRVPQCIYLEVEGGGQSLRQKSTKSSSKKRERLLETFCFECGRAVQVRRQPHDQAEESIFGEYWVCGLGTSCGPRRIPD